MAIFEWSEKYSVGIAKLDHQHQTLFEIINQLHSAMSSGQGQSELGVILDRPIDYTQNHFANEEKIMTHHGYLQLAEHRQAHVELTQQVLDFKEKYRSGKIGLSIQLTQFLKNWLTTHILGEDKQYSLFFQSLNIH